MCKLNRFGGSPFLSFRGGGPNHLGTALFATLSVPLQAAAREDKQYGTMHLIPYMKPIAMCYHKNSLSMKYQPLNQQTIG